LPKPPGLLDPGSGALACNGGGDVCMEILRRQQEEQWRVVQENIEAVSEAEWALFWTYTGGAAIRAIRAAGRLIWAARGGVPLARAIEGGLVKQGGKLAQVLGGIEKGYAAAGPKNALEALGVVKNATSAVGLEPGVATVGKAGEIVLQNVGGVTTTLGTNGSILVQRGSDVLLHLVP
ncbi:MAG TPA: hypothetical protein VKY73_16530, partial [Polyangiaceae bacterium]|nr:hypothetical protein [Polyangiaceae bacterium]